MVATWWHVLSRMYAYASSMYIFVYLSSVNFRLDTCHFCSFVVLCFDNVKAGDDVRLPQSATYVLEPSALVHTR